MSHNRLITFLLLVVSLGWITGCSDDDSPSVQNSITMNGTPFAVKAVSLLGVSIDGEGHAALTFTSVSGSITKSLSVDFDYSPTVAISGTYTYPQTNGTGYLDDWLTHYTEFNSTNEIVSTNLKTGTLKLEDHGGSRYTFTIDLTMENGTVFKGTYKGQIQAVFQNG